MDMPVDVPVMVVEERAGAGVQQVAGTNWLLAYGEDATPVLLVRHAQELPPPPPEPVVRDSRRVVVHFRTDAVDIAEVKKDLDAIPANGRYAVLGFADPRGGKKYNEKLSLARAKAVAAYLQSRGVDASAVFGFGERELKSGGSRRAYQYDRRVEIKPLAADGEQFIEE